MGITPEKRFNPSYSIDELIKLITLAMMKRNVPRPNPTLKYLLLNKMLLPAI